MAVWTIKNEHELCPPYVLAPERYDPRRELASLEDRKNDILLSSVARITRQTVSSASATAENYLILDTTHAQEGLIIRPKRTFTGNEIGSAKKCAEVNDVIVSRLRPYLRQVGFIDERLCLNRGTSILCSTEYFVLRSLDEQSIAFLVPFLLSAPVQQVLAAAQEGGHHPRFNEGTLNSLPIPNSILKGRKETSDSVVTAIDLYRKSSSYLQSAIDQCNAAFLDPPNPAQSS